MEALLQSFRLTPDPETTQDEQAPSAPAPDDVNVRALNPDNHQDADKLIELFTQNFGKSHPFQHVYNPNFWLRAVDDTEEDEDDQFNITSIIAEEGGRFIAHLALRRDAMYPDRVEILLPAVHPAFRKHMFRITRVLWSVISNLAHKQQWRVAYHFSSVLHPACQLMSVKCFKSIEVALISTCRESQQTDRTQICRPERRASALMFYNVFDPESLAAVTIYPPAQHLSSINNTYAALKLRRTYSADGNSNETQREKRTQVITARRGKIQTEPQFESERIFQGLHFVTLPGDFVQHPVSLPPYLHDLRQSTEGKPVLAIALDTPTCPVLCELLERQGFRYTGIMPLVGARDYILYTEFVPELMRDLPVYSRLAKNLRGYLSDYTNLLGMH